MSNIEKHGGQNEAKPIHDPDYGSANAYNVLLHTFHICINTMIKYKMTLFCMKVPCLQASVLTFDITNIVSYMWYKTNVSLDLCE